MAHGISQVSTMVPLHKSAGQNVAILGNGAFAVENAPETQGEIEKDRRQSCTYVIVVLSGH